MKRFLRPLLLSLLWRGVVRKLKFEQPRVIAVTGSIGKTSAKEAIALILEASDFPVVKTHGNLGTDVGVPLSLLGFDELPTRFGWINVVYRSLFPYCIQYQKRPYYILEYSSDKPGDIAFLTERLPADVGVITQIAPVHLQFFTDLAALTEEELAIRHGLKSGGVLVANADDPAQLSLKQGSVPIIWYGIKDMLVERSEAGLLIIVDGVRYQTLLLGTHQLIPLLAAIAVGQMEGITTEDLQAQVALYQVPAGRGRMLEGRDGITIIDDTYNASPEAVKASLRMLKEVAGTRTTVAVLGQMNELGAQAETLHREVGAAASTVDRLVVIGPHGLAMKEAAIDAGISKDCVTVFATSEECLERFAELVFEGDVVLVKASQNGMRLERLVKGLLKDQTDSKHLVRQSLSWKQV